MHMKKVRFNGQTTIVQNLWREKKIKKKQQLQITNEHLE